MDGCVHITNTEFVCPPAQISCWAKFCESSPPAVRLNRTLVGKKGIGDCTKYIFLHQGYAMLLYVTISLSKIKRLSECSSMFNTFEKLFHEALALLDLSCNSSAHVVQTFLRYFGS